MKKFLEIFKKMDLTKRLILYFSVIITIQMIFIGWFSNSWISLYLKNDQIKKMVEINSILVQEINQIRNRGEELSDRILFNDALQALLSKSYDETHIYEIYSDINDVEAFLGDPNAILNTVIVGENGTVYQSRGNEYDTVNYEKITNSLVYKKSLESDGRNIWISANENIMNMSKEPFLYVSRTLKSSSKFSNLGQLLIQMPFNALNNVFEQSGTEPGEYYEIIDKNGICIYSTLDVDALGEKIDENILSSMTNDTDGYDTIERENKEYLLAYSKYSLDGWDIVHILPMRIITSSAREVRNIILLIMLFPLIILIPLQIYLSRNISQPIKKLKEAVEKFGEGDLNTRTDIDRMDEIGGLQSSFNTMAEDINRLVDKVAEEHKHLRVMELDMIESQINPHFLYNSLDSINWMAQKAGNNDIEEMVSALAKFFRVGLSKGKEFIKIKEELEHIKQYLFINKIRFKDSYQFEIDVDPEMLDCYTIKIILQPIVENAIKYGIRKNSNDGFVKVTASKNEDSILFSVSDNGQGIPAKRLQIIKNVLAKRTQIDENSGNGFGLFNVNQRIWLHFGDGYGVTIDSIIDFGTTVSLRIPLLKHPRITD